MSEHYDALEHRAPDAREAALLRALPAHIAHAKAQAPAFARSLAQIDAAAVTSRRAQQRICKGNNRAGWRLPYHSI